MFDRRFDQVLNMGQQERLGAFFSKDAVVNIDMSNPKLPLRAVKGVQPILEYFDSVRNMAAGAWGSFVPVVFRFRTCDMLCPFYYALTQENQDSTAVDVQRQAAREQGAPRVGPASAPPSMCMPPPPGRLKVKL
jgi:hypothetical protein